MSIEYYRGIEEFEAGRYEEALNSFILSYHNGDDKEDIMNIILSCFVEPNMEELRDTYETNANGTTKINYQELPLMLIPISDSIFFIYDKEQDCFLGKIDLSLFQLNPHKIEFESALITDTWDIREVTTLLGNSFPRCVFWITNDEGRSVSFLQIPGIMESYWGNILLFKSETLFQFYFEQMKEEFLPHKIISKRVDYFSGILKKIHEDRIHDPEAKRNNIFLSICIPSYNRGEDAYAAVCEALKSGYDQEIEVIISNNGSTCNRSGYERIKTIQDNRVRYYEAPESMGFYGNINKVIEMARGEFIAFQSDQERIISAAIPCYMNALYNNPQIFAATSSGEGPNFLKPAASGINGNRLDILNGIMNQTFLSGLMLRKSSVEKKHVFELFEKMKNNYFLQMYAHIFFLLASYDNDAIYIGAESLWIETDGLTESEGDGVFQYNQPEKRMIQAESAMELLVDVTGVVDCELIFLLEERYKRVFDLMRVGIFYYEQDFLESGFNWQDTCLEVYQWALSVGMKYRDRISDDNYEIWEKRCKEIYESRSNSNVWNSEGE